MRILFFAEELLDYTNPTANLARLIGRQWIEDGHDVIYLCNDQLNTKKLGSKWKEDFEQSKCYRYKEPYTLYWRELKQSGQSRIISVLKQPRLVRDYIDALTGIRNNTAKRLAKYVDKIVVDEKPDVIYTITEPYMSALALAYSKCDCKKRIYMGDPFAFAPNRNNTNRTFNRAVALEKLVMARTEKIFTTDIALKSYKDSGLFDSYMDKIKIVEFPNVRPISIDSDTDIQSKYLVQDRINCVFAGRFYEDIRRPEFMLDIFEKMNSDELVLHIFGGGMEEVVALYKNRMGDRLRLHGMVSGEELMRVLPYADIMVSLNNSASNQVPSKLFEAFSLGLPVINMCYLRDCPTLPYSAKYPLCENIFADDDISVNLDRINDFIQNATGLRVAFEDVRNIFYTSTPEFVAKELLS